MLSSSRTQFAASVGPSTSYARTVVVGDEDASGEDEFPDPPALSPSLLTLTRWPSASTPVLLPSSSLPSSSSRASPASPSRSESPPPHARARSPPLQLKREHVSPPASPPPSPPRRPTKRQRVNVPAPVPNLTKKSRGRRVPRADDQLAPPDAGRKYVCPVPECAKGFSRGEHLKRHTRSIHTNDRPFTCPVAGCLRTFTRHDNLLQHQRAHATPLLVPNT